MFYKDIECSASFRKFSPLSSPHCQFEKAFLSVNGLLCVQYYQLKKIDISRQLKKFSKYIILLLKIRNATSIQTSDAKNAKRVRLFTCSKMCRALQASTSLRIWQNVYNTLWFCILKSLKCTPKRPQINPDHTRSSQEHAFGTYFLTGPHQNSFSSLSPNPNRGNPPPYFKWPFGRWFSFQKWKKYISGHN